MEAHDIWSIDFTYFNKKTGKVCTAATIPLNEKLVGYRNPFKDPKKCYMLNQKPYDTIIKIYDGKGNPFWDFFLPYEKTRGYSNEFFADDKNILDLVLDGGMLSVYWHKLGEAFVVYKVVLNLEKYPVHSHSVVDP